MSAEKHTPAPMWTAATPQIQLRDWFAGQALTEFANLISVKHSAETAKIIAILSYRVADAMLKAREA